MIKIAKSWMNAASAIEHRANGEQPSARKPPSTLLALILDKDADARVKPTHDELIGLSTCRARPPADVHDVSTVPSHGGHTQVRG
jgi:hypothetical protein